MSPCEEANGISPIGKESGHHSDAVDYDLSAAGDQEASMDEEGAEVEKGVGIDVDDPQQVQVDAPGDLPGGEDEVQAPRAARSPESPAPEKSQTTSSPIALRGRGAITV